MDDFSDSDYDDYGANSMRYDNTDNELEYLARGYRSDNWDDSDSDSEYDAKPKRAKCNEGYSRKRGQTRCTKNKSRSKSPAKRTKSKSPAKKTKSKSPAKRTKSKSPKRKSKGVKVNPSLVLNKLTAQERAKAEKVKNGTTAIKCGLACRNSKGKMIKLKNGRFEARKTSKGRLILFVVGTMASSTGSREVWRLLFNKPASGGGRASSPAKSPGRPKAIRLSKSPIKKTPGRPKKTTKAKSKSPKRVPCKSNQYRNPSTGRCKAKPKAKKAKSKSKSPKRVRFDI